MTDEHLISHSPIPSVDESTLPGFTLSDVSSLKSASSGSEQSLDRVNSFSLNLNEVDKKLRHVRFLIDEMIETELTYIKALTDVIDGYIKRLRKDTSSGFTKEIMDKVFVNIEEICSFHEKLHSQLSTCDGDHQLIAQTFIDNIDKLAEMYITFCSAFPKSLEQLDDLHHTDPYKSALSQCQTELGHIFPVEEYLHRAVQRFLKYPLLFKDMAKKLTNLEGHSVVQETLNKLLVTAVKINSVKRVQELQAHELIGWKGGDLKNMGDLLLEDSFKVSGTKDPRHLFLFKDGLLFTKKKDNDGVFTFKNLVSMNNITLKEQVDSDFLKWTVLGKGSTSFTLISKDADQKDQWTREMKRCIVYSTPGLTDIEKEQLLLKLPSLKNNVDHISNIWKKVSKKNKKLSKRSESVKILHNTECESDTFSINSEISQAFDVELQSPINNHSTVTSPSDSGINSEFGLTRKSAYKKKIGCEEESVSIEDTPSYEETTSIEEHEEEGPLLEVDSGVLSIQTDITESEIVDDVDSDLDNIISDKQEPTLTTGTDGALSYLTSLLLSSSYYPGNVLLVVYLLACLLYFLPVYITILLTLSTGYCFVKFAPKVPELKKFE